MTGRRIDYLFTFVVLLWSIYSFALFASANVVPTGGRVDFVKDAAGRSLFWYRFNYVVGAMFMASRAALTALGGANHALESAE